MERLVRLAFFQFLWRDPWFVFETFFIVKGKLIWGTIVDATVTEWSRAPWRARLAVLLGIALIGVMAARRPGEWHRLARVSTVVTIGALASLSIPILTVPTWQTMSEETMTIQIACMLLISLLFAYLARAVGFFQVFQVVHSRKTREKPGTS